LSKSLKLSPFVPFFSYRSHAINNSKILLLQSSRAARYREPCVNGDWALSMGNGDYVGDPYGCAKSANSTEQWRQRE